MLFNKKKEEQELIEKVDNIDLFRKMQEIKISFDFKLDMIEHLVEKVEVQGLTELLEELLSDLKVINPRVEIKTNYVEIQLRCFFDPYQLIYNNYICNKLNTVSKNLVFKPYLLQNKRNYLKEGEVRISLNDIYVKVRNIEGTANILDIYVDDLFLPDQTEGISYEISNLIFNEIEEIEILIGRKFLLEREDNMVPISEFRLFKAQEKEMFEFLSQKNTYSLDSTKVINKLQVFEAVCSDSSFLRENIDMDNLKLNMPYATLISCLIPPEMLDNIRMIMARLMSEDLDLVAVYTGDRVYIDYFVYNKSKFFEVIKIINEKFNIQIDFLEN